MSLAVSEFIIQIDKQSSDPLPTSNFKFATRIRVITARVVMSLVKGAGFVPNNLEVLATVQLFSSHFTRFGEDLSGHWVVLGYPRRLTRSGSVVTGLTVRADYGAGCE
jgi:hypothetical protein